MLRHVDVLQLLQLSRAEVPCDEVCIAGRPEGFPPCAVTYLAEGDLGLEVVRHDLILHYCQISREGVRERMAKNVPPALVPFLLEVAKHQSLPFPFVRIFLDYHPDTAGGVVDIGDEGVAGLHRSLCIVSVHQDLLDLDIALVLSIPRETFKPCDERTILPPF